MVFLAKLITKISWNCTPENINRADLCVNEGQKLSECRVSLAERKKEEEGEMSIFDCVWFSMKTDVLEGAAMYTGSISHMDNCNQA